MRKTIISIGMLCSFISYAQTKKDSTQQKNINEVVLVGKKPTVKPKLTVPFLMFLTALYLQETLLGKSLA
jgi:hypothetical protein